MLYQLCLHWVSGIYYSKTHLELNKAWKGTYRKCLQIQKYEMKKQD